MGRYFSHQRPFIVIFAYWNELSRMIKILRIFGGNQLPIRPLLYRDMRERARLSLSSIRSARWMMVSPFPQPIHRVDVRLVIASEPNSINACTRQIKCFRRASNRANAVGGRGQIKFISAAVCRPRLMPGNSRGMPWCRSQPELSKGSYPHFCAAAAEPVERKAGEGARRRLIRSHSRRLHGLRLISC